MPLPTQRFSTRVENYVRYRPHYPKEVLDFLRTDCGLTVASVVADVGSGTGFLAELFLLNGNKVFGIEPNDAMRKAGERLLRQFQKFESVAGTAESTNLPDACVDFITAGQAFHWFDQARCRNEFKRILQLHGWVVLVWNDRRTGATPFLAKYEQLLHTYGTDYTNVDHKQIDATVLCEFFGVTPVMKAIPYYQHFDLPSLTGRLLSSSYVPEASQLGYQEMLEALNLLFEECQVDGRVSFEYDTRVFYARFKRSA